MIDMTNITALPSGNYRVRLEYRGQVLGGTFGKLDDAVETRDALKHRLADGDLRGTGGSSAFELGPRFLASRAGNRSVDDDENRWHLRIATASWARLSISDVTRKDGLAWLEDLKKERTAYDARLHGARPDKLISWGLRRHCLNLARRFFQWCIDDEEILTTNPFAGLSVEREDGDEDEGYQEEWFVDVAEQMSIFDIWLTLKTLDARDRLERFIYGVALWTGLRLSELWCLHLSDFHVDGPKPHLVVRYGSWDAIKERFRSPKGRKGEKKRRIVHLWGFGLDCAREWLKVRAEYLRMNPRTERERAAKGYKDSGLVFPSERGRLRSDAKPPRSWKKVSEAFGVVPRIGLKPWWHLLRHSCASALVSGSWGILYGIQEVQNILGHTDIRTTQRYAHLAPSALEAKAAEADAAFRLAKVIPIRRDGSSAVTTIRTDHAEAGKTGHARQGSNLRPTAPEAVAGASGLGEIARRDGLVTALRHVLLDVAEKRYALSDAELDALELALDEALAAYKTAVEAAAEQGGAR